MPGRDVVPGSRRGDQPIGRPPNCHGGPQKMAPLAPGAVRRTLVLLGFRFFFTASAPSPLPRSHLAFRL